jgi:hypothetical protein
MVTVLVVASFVWENIHLGTASPDDQELISQIVQASAWSPMLTHSRLLPLRPCAFATSSRRPAKRTGNGPTATCQVLDGSTMLCALTLPL